MEDDEGRTPLRYAVDNPLVSVTKLLLSDKDIDIICTDKYGRTPLRLVVETCRPQCFETLLTHKYINIHLKDKQDRTPLSIAEVLTETIADKQYYKYKEQYEYIIALLHYFSLSAHELKNESTNVISLSDNNSPEASHESDFLPLIYKVVKTGDFETLF